ncbi:serine aminopeptidase domain-containing protein [Tardiphaga sp.]|uniref:serine aminopeptidase domain-containing protein n=1 Tax=Tardiphaga sp. TaxID=1926292 RepID=UPI00352A83D2
MNFRYGSPVTFDTFGGFYHSSCIDRQGRKAVLLLAPIGYEELCTRATWRALAEKIAQAGHACLRFDYPGTADAIDVVGEPDGISDWLVAARQCMTFLRDYNPGAELVLVGQGVGASLAAQLGPESPGIAATVLMAPAVKGRSYLRELQAWSRMVTERMGIGPDPLDGSGYTVAGLPLASSRAAAIKAIDLTKATQPPAARVLLVERTQTSRDRSLGNHLQTLGADVSSIDYAGYEVIMQNPTVAEPQLGTLARIVSWIDDLVTAPMTGAKLPTKELTPARPIAGPHYEELPVRFGPDDRLFGVLCQPLGRKPSAIAVLANSGRDYHIGWGRAAVEQARALAERGIASFRFDAGGIGDSPASAGAPAEVLYSDEQLADTRYAIDYVAKLDAGPIALVGRCSGAYAAFQAAVQDVRVRNVVVINNMRFVWDPRETVAEALLSAHRTIGGSVSLLFSKRSLRRLLSGNLRLKAPIAFVSKRLLQILSLRPSQILARRQLYGEGHRRFQTLANRDVRLAIMVSEGDHALGEFHTYMGRKGARLRRYPNASISIIPNADHDFTHAYARARLTNALCDVLAASSRQ